MCDRLNMNKCAYCWKSEVAKNSSAPLYVSQELLNLLNRDNQIVEASFWLVAKSYIMSYFDTIFFYQ